MRKICVVTGSRAEYGVFYWLMKGIAADAELILQVVATGMHLAPEFGLTYRQIEADGFMIDAKVEMLLSSETRAGITKSVGLGLLGFADAYHNLSPDVVLVMGDRFEILAATQAAFLAGIPLVHISGGELTEGSLDDVMRHCMSKMSNYHFVAAQAYRKRVIQLGETPESVFNVGDPGLDNINKLTLLECKELSSQIGFNLEHPYFLVTYHPVTTGLADNLQAMQQLFSALEEFPQYNVLITRANADIGGREINAWIDAYTSRLPKRFFVTTSLGQLNYLSAMQHCLAVVGNSSSGIIEAPALKVPTVNIGSRQQGRLKATSIIDTANDCVAIVQAINRVLTNEFKFEVRETVSLYGDCHASELILEKIKTLEFKRYMKKHFYDLPD